MRQDIEGVLNEGAARDTGRPISEPANFASRPWTHADDDKLRRLALAGFSVRAIGIRLSRTETAVLFSGETAAGHLEKTQAQTTADGLKPKS